MYKLSLLDIVGITPIRMTFSVAFACLEGEHLNNVFWVLQRFQGLFMRVDAFLGVIVTDRDLSLMNIVKTVFPNATNLLCRFHIEGRVQNPGCSKKCMRLCHGGSLVNFPCKSSFDESFFNRWLLFFI